MLVKFVVNKTRQFIISILRRFLESDKNFKEVFCYIFTDAVIVVILGKANCNTVTV